MIDIGTISVFGINRIEVYYELSKSLYAIN